MIEIIPNIHPIFVNFTVALCGTSTSFYVLAYVTNSIWQIPNRFNAEFEVVARWCLWVAAFITVLTIITGLWEYNAADYDAQSYVVMMNHLHWSLLTASVIFLITLWSVWFYHKRKSLTLPFILALLIMQGLIAMTVWHGSELVFSYGVGVIEGA